MGDVLTVLMCLGVALVILGALSKAKVSRWDGFMVKDRNGRVGITLNPVKSKKKRKRRR